MPLTSSAIVAIQVALPSLQNARTKLWSQIDGMWHRTSDGGAKLDKEDMPSLEWQLDDLSRKIIVAYELAGLRYAVEQFDSVWKALPAGQEDLWYDSQYLDGYRSHRLDHAIKAIEALRIFGEDEVGVERFLRNRCVGQTKRFGLPCVGLRGWFGAS